MNQDQIDLISSFAEWRLDLYGFVKDVLGVEHVSNQQKEACREISLIVSAKTKLERLYKWKIELGIDKDDADVEIPEHLKLSDEMMVYAKD